MERERASPTVTNLNSRGSPVYLDSKNEAVLTENFNSMDDAMDEMKELMDMDPESGKRVSFNHNYNPHDASPGTFSQQHSMMSDTEDVMKELIEIQERSEMDVDFDT